MHLLRKLKLSKIQSVQFTEEEQNAIFFIKDRFRNLNRFTTDEYQNSVFFIQTSQYVKGTYLLEYIDRKLYVRWGGFCSELNHVFKIKIEDIEGIIKYFLPNEYSLPFDSIKFSHEIDALNNRVFNLYNEKYRNFDYSRPYRVRLI